MRRLSDQPKEWFYSDPSTQHIKLYPHLFTFIKRASLSLGKPYVISYECIETTL
jgi:hypothetical protein